MIPTTIPSRKERRSLEHADSGPLAPRCRPPPDVQAGRDQQAEFAADLAHVRAGHASAEYSDPVEFFRRTSLTAGMRRLLVAAIGRLRGTGEAPVVQLKTAFGGGKTHTMLALYYLLTAPEAAMQVPAVRHLLEEAGGLPPKAAGALVAGTRFGPTHPPATQAGLAEVSTIMTNAFSPAGAALGDGFEDSMGEPARFDDLDTPDSSAHCALVPDLQRPGALHLDHPITPPGLQAHSALAAPSTIELSPDADLRRQAIPVLIRWEKPHVAFPLLPQDIADPGTAALHQLGQRARQALATQQLDRFDQRILAWIECHSGAAAA